MTRNVDSCEPKVVEVEKEVVREEEEQPPLCPQKKASDLIYSIEDVPPWYECVVYGFQHYLAMVSSTISNPIVLATFLCLEEGNPARGTLVSTIIFMSGVITLLQSTFGVRLPIIQGGNFAYLVPSIAILTATHPACSTLPLANMTAGEREEVWQIRLREIQGAIALSSIFQVVIGFTGVVGLLLRWITPLTVVPTVTLVGLSLFDVASRQGASHWGICVLTVGLSVVFSQHLQDVAVWLPMYRKGSGFSYTTCKPFKTLSLLLAIITSWLVCVALTASDLLPEGSAARTDMTIPMLRTTPWFRFPYPGQWGLPRVNLAATVGMLGAVLSSIIESVGDYYACARVVDAPLPPTHAINRGIGVEGVGCMLAGLWGTGSGTTSYSGNIGILSITKVGSRRVIQYSGVIMMVCGLLAKLGVVFVTIPQPVIAGVFYIKFSMTTAVGLSTLQYIDLTSSRNLFVLGTSLFFGISVPKWLEANPSAIQTGVLVLDQTMTVLMQTSMFLGGFVGLVLDNTIPGSDEERGMLKWRGRMTQGGPAPAAAPDHHYQETTASTTCYHLPLGSHTVNKTKWCRYVPFCTTFDGFPTCKSITKDKGLRGFCC